MNLSLGGTRNFTHQYKGIETASGGNLALVCNQVNLALLCFRKGCTELSFGGGTSASNTQLIITQEQPHISYISTEPRILPILMKVRLFIVLDKQVMEKTILFLLCFFTVDDTVVI